MFRTSKNNKVVELSEVKLPYNNTHRTSRQKFSAKKIAARKNVHKNNCTPAQNIFSKKNRNQRENFSAKKKLQKKKISEKFLKQFLPFTENFLKQKQ
jgi:hypothetical protein